MLDYADDSCALQRNFAVGDKAAILEMRRFLPGENLRIAFATNMADRREKLTQFRWEPDAAFTEQRDTAFVQLASGMNGVMFSAQLFPDQDDDAGSEPEDISQPVDPVARAAREQSVVGATLSGSFAKDITLNLGNMHQPMEALRVCMDELLTHWGIDAEAHKALTRKATPRNLSRLARDVQRFYPNSGLRQEQDAWIQIRLGVDAEGKVSACHLQAPVMNEDFKASACKGLSVARFKPALDASGNPIASYWGTKIYYDYR